MEAENEFQVKKQKLICSDNLISQFQEYAKEFDEVNEKRERIVKASRDVTSSSKKVIFQIHRIDLKSGNNNFDSVEENLKSIRECHVSKIAKEVNAFNYWKYHRSFTSGIQEYIEAASFFEFLKNSRLLTLNEINFSFSNILNSENISFSISRHDYILGLCDLTGELMRLAINSLANENFQIAFSISHFVDNIYKNIFQLPKSLEIGHEVKKKMEIMQQSLMKIENVCYILHVRGSEYPKEMLLDKFQLLSENEMNY